MQEMKWCTIALKKFNIMNLFYPVIFALVGALALGVPLGLVAGIIDTAFLKTGTLVDIAIWIFVVLWSIIIIFSSVSFFKAVDAMAKTVDALCIGDEKKLYNIWIVILLDIVTLGIYKFVYFYQLQSRLEQRAHEYNQGVVTSPSNLLVFTILSSIVGLGYIVGCGLMIEDINSIVYLSNEDNNFQTKEYQNWGLKDFIRKIRARFI